MSSNYSVTAHEEATWHRVLVQAGCGLGMYLMVLVATRLWTSFTFLRFQKRRHKNSLDTAFAVVDILFSLGSQACFIAYTYKREYNKYLVRVVSCRSAPLRSDPIRSEPSLLFWARRLGVGAAPTLSDIHQ